LAASFFAQSGDVGCPDEEETPCTDVEGPGKLAVVGSGACGAFGRAFEGSASVGTSIVGQGTWRI